MRITVKSFNGHTLNNADYLAVGLNFDSLPTAKPVFIEQARADAVNSGMFTVDIRTLALHVRVKNYTDRIALQAQLRGWFYRGTRGDLVVSFAVDGLDYFMTCQVLNMTRSQDDPMVFIIQLQTGDTAWRAVDPDTSAWHGVTGTGGTKTVTVESDVATRLSAVLTTVGAPTTGYLYQALYRLVNPPGIALGARPWCITMDTASLISAGKMQADCDDLRLFSGSVEIRRWIANPNTSATKIWFYGVFAAGFSLNLAGAVAGAGSVAYLQFSLDATHKAIITAMPDTGVIYHGTEWFNYKGRDPQNCRLLVQSRGAFGTALQAHSPGDVFKYIQYPIIVQYGNALATNPALGDATYDIFKPLFSLVASDNSQWTYDNTSLFWSAVTTRPGAWGGVGGIKQGPVSKFYAIKEDALSGDPAMGLKNGAYLVGAVWKADNTTLGWLMYQACGIASINTSVRVYRNAAGWFGISGLQSSIDNVNWPYVFPEAPSGTGSWEPYSSGVIALPTGTKYVRFYISGTFSAAPNAVAYFEVLSCVLNFVTANLPSGALLGEVLNYPLDIRLRNNANGDSLDLYYPMINGKSFTIDGENFDAHFDKFRANGAIQLNDPGRGDGWLRLEPGANELEIVSPDVGTLDVDLSWYRRRL